MYYIHNSSKIAEHASIWLDSYFSWIDPRSGCCSYDKTTVNHTMCNNHSDPSMCVSVSVSVCVCVCARLSLSASVSYVHVCSVCGVVYM